MSYTSNAPAADAVQRTPALRSGISWGAVLAGGILAVAVAVTLNILGAGFAAMAVDAVGRDTPDAATMSLGAVSWMVIVYTLALFVGGYTAARLSGTFSDTDGVLHGLSVWAVVLIVTALIMGNAVMGVASGVAQLTGRIAGGAATIVSSAAERIAPTSSPEAMLERVQRTLRGTGLPPGQMTTEERGAEIASILGQRVQADAFTPQDRERLNALVAAEFGITQEDAAQRVQQAEAEARQMLDQAEARAREAADAAAQAAYLAAFSVFGTLMLGALGAVIGAGRGTRDMQLVTRARGEAYDTSRRG
jgi:hypothetical protein